MKVADIANEIFLENGSPTDTSIASIAFWVRSNVGQLNAKLYESFYVDPNNGFEIFKCDGQLIGKLAAAIIKKMYEVYRVQLDIRKLMAGMQVDMVLSAEDQGFKVVRLNRSEILKTLNTMKETALKELTDLVHNYRSYHGAPTQVAGDDTEKGYFVETTDGFIRGFITD